MKISSDNTPTVKDALLDVHWVLARQLGVLHVLFVLEIALDIRPTTGGRLPKTGWLAALAYLVNWKNARSLYKFPYTARNSMQ